MVLPESATSTITVDFEVKQVNDPPVIEAITAITIDEGNENPSFTLNFSDVDNADNVPLRIHIQRKFRVAMRMLPISHKSGDKGQTGATYT